MNNIFSNGFQTRNIEPLSQPITQFSIFPRIAYSKIEKDDYYLTFQNFCAPLNLSTINNFNFDQNLLKKKLEAWIKPEDRKYIKLVYFTTIKSIFKFDVDLWLQDALKDNMATINYSTFSKSYRLKKQLPYMVRVWGLTNLYEKHVAEKFKQLLKRQPKNREDVFSMITKFTGKTLGLDKINYFEYSYNWQSNTITVNLKPIYFASILATASLYLKKKKTNKVDFDKSVMKFLKIC